jgi:hypothetical protein
MHHDDLTPSLRIRRLGWACLLLAACGADLEPLAGPATGENPKDKQTVEIPTKNPPVCTITDFDAAPSPAASLVIDIAATDASLVAVDSSGGLRSLDGGASWSAVSLPITKILAADSSGYVALGYDDVVYLSDSSGEIWQEATQGLPDAKVAHLAIGGGVATAVAGDTGYRWNGVSWDALEIPTPTVVLVATDGQRFLAASHEGLFVSPDGASWSPTSLDLDWGFFALAVEGDLMLASHVGGLARSEDGGANWTVLTGLDNPVGLAKDLLIHGDGALAAGFQGIFSSLDGGATWSPVPDTGSFASMGLARQGNTWFVSGGEVQKSTDGTSWSPVDTLRTRRVEAFYALGEALIATSEDGFTHRLVDGDWQRFDAAEKMIAAVEQEGALYGILQGTHYTDMVRSLDGGASWSTMPAVGGTPSARIGSLVSVQGTLLAGSTTILGGGSKTGGTAYPGIGIQRSVDGGMTWQSANAGLPVLGYHDADTTVHPYVVALFAAGDDAYAVVDGAGLLRSSDAGLSWTLLDPLLGEEATIWLDVAAAANGHLIASSRQVEGVLLEIDADGAKPRAGAGLPEGFRIAALLAHEGAILATVHGEEGIYVSHDDGATFTLAAEIGDAGALALHDNRLWIAAYGEGVVTADLGCK